MTFEGVQKFTLLDYPGKIAATLFTPGCNFRCPFCHNSEIVTANVNKGRITSDEILTFLSSRKGLLQGVCITGGEPTLQSGLLEFINEVKAMGFFVKLDTNGERPDVLQSLLDLNVLDYVAMDVKNSLKSYALTVGIENFDTSHIQKSIAILKKSTIDYEFRTTVVKEFHQESDFDAMYDLLKGARLWRLQEFRDSPNCFSKNLHPIPSDELKLLISRYLSDKTIQIY